MSNTSKPGSKLNRIFTADRRDSAVFLIVALIVLAISMFGVSNPGGVLALILYPTPSAQHDRWVTNDLSNIAQAANQYTGQGSAISLGYLNVQHLHFPSSKYSFTWNAAVGGAPATYTLCATFDRSAISKSTNISQTYQNGDLSIYSIHHKGRQCYETNLGPYTSGTRLVE